MFINCTSVVIHVCFLFDLKLYNLISCIVIVGFWPYCIFCTIFYHSKFVFYLCMFNVLFVHDIICQSVCTALLKRSFLADRMLFIMLKNK